MTTDPIRPSNPCDEAAPHLAEFALATLTGQERSDVLAHLERCTRCSVEVEQLSSTADALLQTAPEVEPPVGLEVRVFDALGVSPPARPSARPSARPRTHATARLSPNPQRRVRLALAAAAVVAVAAVGFGVGWSSAPGPTRTAAVRPGSAAPTSGAVVEQGHLTMGGGRATRLVGRVALVGGSPAWVLMSVHGVAYSGQATCRVTLTDGSTVTVGSFWLRHGAGAWSARLRVPVAAVRSASVLDWGGHVLASGAVGV